MSVDFTVPGIPVQQGSKKVFNRRVVDDNADILRPWRDSVTWAARDAWKGQPPMQGAVSVGLRFTLVRPPSVSEKRRPRPSVKPDLDKLIRAILDSVTVAGVWKDDAQVVSIGAGKAYGQLPGVAVYISEVNA